MGRTTYFHVLLMLTISTCMLYFRHFSSLCIDWSSFCIIFYHITMHFINKNRIFNCYLSYFSGPIFNGKEGPNHGFFKDLKEFIGAKIKEAQFYNEPGDIPKVLEAPAGYLHHNRMSE